ncbi:endolytic transglycosylase MltG [Candidatus Saccharibacteria bacterium]|nr:endolytic transglycosylase MltG [Candidatus Saccharibacteria bacterium]
MKLLSLDVGEKRIGVAKADTSVRIAVPSGMLPVDGNEINSISRLCKIQNTDIIVVGMPRNLQGQLTKQSDYVKEFVKNLNQALTMSKPSGKTIKIFFQDESLTSVEAKQNLKAKNPKKATGEIDAEAAAIILQDFLENLETRLPGVKIEPPAEEPKPETPLPSTPPEEPTEKVEIDPLEDTFKAPKENSVKRRPIFRIIIIIVAVLGLGILGLSFWYNTSIGAVISTDKCSPASESDPCAFQQFVVKEGTSVSQIADSLNEAGLIKSSLAFKVYAKLSGKGGDLKAGTYSFAPSMPVEHIYTKLIEGSDDAVVFRFTALPGETLNDIKQRLISLGYTQEEVETAFAKRYDHKVLADKPLEASLEGYLFGETYEFYQTDTVETIITRMLDELSSVVDKYGLKEKFNKLGLTLHEGIILASVVQKEAGIVSKEDQEIVAQVFLSRLNQAIPLGSDVTATYAANQVDPNRNIYTDNAAVLNIDSCYNTRRYPGLPCGPISNPGVTTLLATSEPADTSYLYFLTGDDGLMYYSYTETEHNQNARDHCQVLCDTQL